ncbi:MAG TPA: hypothetical protein VGL75_07690 [Acidothermaceae bacterium]|jgi:hypothetical protein
MSAVRIYLPATLPGLTAAGVGSDKPASQIEVAAAGARACAVTPALREWYREGDLDELEYAAMTRAALASLRLLAQGGGDRRVVLAADVADDAVVFDQGDDPAAVRVLASVHFDQVVSAHVDDSSAAIDVVAAGAQVEAADLGDDDAQFVIEGLEDHELQWYAVQEIASLLR